MEKTDTRLVTLGHVLGPWGVKGWVKIRSYTEPRDNIVRFPTWILCRDGTCHAAEVEQGRAHGRDQVVAKLATIGDRDAAAALSGAEIAVAREALAPCDEGEFYWTDLEGLRVSTLDGQDLGRVDHLLRTGSNDVLVVNGERQRLIPFIDGQVVKTVDTQAGCIVVDWDPAF